GAEVRDPKEGCREPGAEVRNPKEGRREAGAEVRDPKEGCRGPGAEVRDPKEGCRELWAEVRDPKEGCRGGGPWHKSKCSRSPPSGAERILVFDKAWHIRYNNPSEPTKGREAAFP
ncbi:MAG: hypothetical protein LBQ12_10300, partial [Deltaproteobacteria bacterium]|nr:hypothetical protein [Deltaproteobacteria bacterium]